MRMTYLDHAATTPVLPEVRAAMARALEEDFGNPSSVHGYGRRARALVETAREQVAAAIGASPSEICFTGCGSEADNLALKGAVARHGGGHVVTTAIEHHAVLATAEYLRDRAGVALDVIGVGADGVVDPGAIAGAVGKGTAVVSVMAVNNEIGTLQPVTEIAAAVKAASGRTLVHTDAVQALGNIPVDVSSWGVDLAAFSAHKLGGPKGVGCLYVRSGVSLEPLIHGGGHEHGLRSGTLNVPGIVGFGAAAEIAAAEVGAKAARVRRLRDRLLEGMRAAVPDLVVNGDLERRSPNNLNVSLPGTEGETLLLLLDQAGIACSTGSACQSGALDPSHVLLALGVPPRLADASLRFTFGRDSTDADVDAVLEVLPRVVAQARRAA